MVHWHGIRLPASMDGTGEVQQPILPGESFEYRFIVPDAGTFWYHSHQNETVQMEKGMYGGIVIEDDTDPVLDHEKVLVLDDMQLKCKTANLRSTDLLAGGLKGMMAEKAALTWSTEKKLYRCRCMPDRSKDGRMIKCGQCPVFYTKPGW